MPASRRKNNTDNSFGLISVQNQKTLLERVPMASGGTLYSAIIGLINDFREEIYEKNEDPLSGYELMHNILQHKFNENGLVYPIRYLIVENINADTLPYNYHVEFGTLPVEYLDEDEQIQNFRFREIERIGRPQGQRIRIFDDENAVRDRVNGIQDRGELIDELGDIVMNFFNLPNETTNKLFVEMFYSVLCYYMMNARAPYRINSVEEIDEILTRTFNAQSSLIVLFLQPSSIQYLSILIRTIDNGGLLVPIDCANKLALLNNIIVRLRRIYRINTLRYSYINQFLSPQYISNHLFNRVITELTTLNDGNEQLMISTLLQILRKEITNTISIGNEFKPILNIRPNVMGTPDPNYLDVVITSMNDTQNKWNLPIRVVQQSPAIDAGALRRSFWNTEFKQLVVSCGDQPPNKPLQKVDGIDIPHFVTQVVPPPHAAVNQDDLVGEYCYTMIGGVYGQLNPVDINDATSNRLLTEIRKIKKNEQQIVHVGKMIAKSIFVDSYEETRICGINLPTILYDLILENIEGDEIYDNDNIEKYLIHDFSEQYLEICYQYYHYANLDPDNAEDYQEPFDDRKQELIDKYELYKKITLPDGDVSRDYYVKNKNYEHFISENAFGYRTDELTNLKSICRDFPLLQLLLTYNPPINPESFIKRIVVRPFAEGVEMNDAVSDIKIADVAGENPTVAQYLTFLGVRLANPLLHTAFRFLFHYIENATPQQLKKLLKFWTGSHIDLYNNKYIVRPKLLAPEYTMKRRPEAHSCFNLLDLFVLQAPQYNTGEPYNQDVFTNILSEAVANGIRYDLMGGALSYVFRINYS